MFSVSPAAVLLGQLALRAARGAGLGAAASHASHLLNLAVWFPKQKSKLLAAVGGESMLRKNTGASSEQLSHSWGFSRSLGSKKAWH